MYIGYDEIITGLCLIALVASSVYVGYLYVLNHPRFYENAVGDVLNNLEKDGIIRLIKDKDGELEILSGYKHDPKTTP